MKILSFFIQKALAAETTKVEDISAAKTLKDIFLKSPGEGGGLTGIYDFILGLLPILATILAVIAITWSVFLFLTSGGDPARIETAKKTLTWTIIGVVILLCAWAILSFVVGGVKKV